MTISEQLLEGLRLTLHQVEQTSGVAADDPAMLDLKKIVLQRISAVEQAKASASSRLDPAGELPIADAHPLNKANS